MAIKRVREGAQTRRIATFGASRLCLKPYRGGADAPKIKYAGMAELADALDSGNDTLVNGS